MTDMCNMPELGLSHNLSPFVRQVSIQKYFNIMNEYTDPDNVFVYIQNGSCNYTLEGMTYRLDAGSVLIFPPFYSHLVVSADTGPIVEYIFHFDLFTGKDAEMPREELLELRRTDNAGAPPHIPGPIYKKLSLIEQNELEKKYLVMHREFCEEKPGYRLMTKALAVELLVLSLRGADTDLMPKDIGANAWSHIEKAMYYIDRHSHDPDLNNSLISRQIGISPNYLLFIFTEHLGLSVHKYLNNVRVNKAKQMIADSDKNFTQIAYECGFSSIHTFSKIFKREVGLSPSKYIFEIQRMDTVKKDKLSFI